MFASITERLKRGLVLKEHPFGNLADVDDATAERLRAFEPLIALHRAGNTIERMAPAVALEALLETDVRVHDGEFVVEHEHRLGPLSYDLTRWLLRLGDEPMSLTTVLDEARRLDARLLVDLKLDAMWVPALVGQLKQYGLLENASFTGRWSALDAVAACSPGTGGLYYGDLNRIDRLERFIAEQPRWQRPGVSVHVDLVTRENVQRLKATGAVVVVYVVTSPDEALAALEAGADGLITNNVALAEVWAR